MDLENESLQIVLNEFQNENHLTEEEMKILIQKWIDKQNHGATKFLKRPQNF